MDVTSDGSVTDSVREEISAFSSAAAFDRVDVWITNSGAEVGYVVSVVASSSVCLPVIVKDC